MPAKVAGEVYVPMPVCVCVFVGVKVFVPGVAIGVTEIYVYPWYGGGGGANSVHVDVPFVMSPGQFGQISGFVTFVVLGGTHEGQPFTDVPLSIIL